MSEQNPYHAPNAAVAELSMDDELAGRGARLGAAIIDLLIQVAVFLPVAYIGGYFTVVMAAAKTGAEPSLATTATWTLVSLVLFAIIQFFPLQASGQTWGKKILKIKIVDLQDRKPDMTKLLGLRYLLVYVISSIPFIGGLLYLINVLMIFRNDRRCGHDLLAGTRVVHAR